MNGLEVMTVKMLGGRQLMTFAIIVSYKTLESDISRHKIMAVIIESDKTPSLISLRTGCYFMRAHTIISHSTCTPNCHDIILCWFEYY